MPARPTLPLRVAIVGSGPAGCFTAEELLHSGRPVALTMFERLPQPFGLVRYGVAPDHPHTRRMLKLMEKTAAAVTLRTGVDVGRDLALDQLRRSFDVTVIATGATEERHLNIPGEDLPGVHTALSFARWVNGHPEYASRSFRFDHDTAVIIGHGNVALDAARLLCREEAMLRETDIAPQALAALSASTIRNIHIIGRRGPVQAAFGEQELLELGHLPGVALRIDPRVIRLSPADELELADPRDERRRTVLNTLREYAGRPDPAAIRRTLHLEFLKSPVLISGTDRMEAITLAENRLDGAAGNQIAVSTGITRPLACGLVLVSVGQRARPIPGLPFDEARGVIPAEHHRVAPGVYAVGWVTRGARGLIGHNRRDAAETVKVILEDFR